MSVTSLIDLTGNLVCLHRVKFALNEDTVREGRKGQQRKEDKGQREKAPIPFGPRPDLAQNLTHEKKKKGKNEKKKRKQRKEEHTFEEGEEEEGEKE